MFRIFQTELIKAKATFVKWLTVLIPTFCASVVMYASRSIVAPGIPKWDVVLCQIFNWWPATFLPLVTALICSLVNSQEKKAGNYRILRLHNVSPAKIWVGKIFIAAYYLLITSLVFIVVTILSGNFLISGGQTPLNKIIEASFTIWITALALIPVQLFASTWKGMAVSIIVGTVGLIAGVFASTTKVWYLIPWSVPLRLMCPIVRTNPNGTYIMDSASKLLDRGVIPIGLGASIAMFTVFTIFTSVWFERREVK